MSKWIKADAINVEIGGGYIDIDAESFMNAPSIDIVRCKECKYERDGEEFMWCEHPNGLDSIVKPDDFCSYGEREGE